MKKRTYFITLLMLFLVLVPVVCLGGGTVPASAHSGNTDSNGGHYQHTEACRNSGYKNHTSACTYHYHTANNSSGNSGINGYNIPSISSEQMQEYTKQQIEQLQNSISSYGNARDSRGSDEVGGALAGIVVLIGGLVFIAWRIKKHISEK